MANNLHILLVLVACYVGLAICFMDDEPVCLSRYDYDYKMLQKTFALEQELKELRQLVDKQSETIQEQSKLRQLVDKQSETIKAHDQVIAKMEQELKDDTRQMEPSGKGTFMTGSTFVRWGRTVCPGNGTKTLYSGQVGGSRYTDVGGASNQLCLPGEPLWDKYDDSKNGWTFVYGTEYEIFGTNSETFFNKKLGNHDALCAVCHSVRSSTVMIPGRNACYDGWTMEYAGYLVAGHHHHKSATEFVCLDKDPEVVQGRQSNHDGKLFYMVEAVCGSLMCPPYVNGRELTCVVCTR